MKLKKLAVWSSAYYVFSIILKKGVQSLWKLSIIINNVSYYDVNL